MDKFAIVLGEPNSINSEILVKSIASKKKCVIIGNFNLLKSQLKILKLKKLLLKINNINEFVLSRNKLTVLNVNLSFQNSFKVSSKESSKYLLKCFNIAHVLAKKKKIKGFINCAINKKNLFKNNNMGVTEYLAKKNKCKNSVVMMIYNKRLSVTPITTHIRLKDVTKIINKKVITKKLKTLNAFYKKIFKKKPKIGVLGLNPHNSELRKNSEENKIIIPTIKSLRKKINLIGPISRIQFLKAKEIKLDVIVGMYHDQVLTPFKALFGFDAVNISLGLPYIRLSPDHGVAEDKIGKNISDAESLNRCIEIILKYKV